MEKNTLCPSGLQSQKANINKSANGIQHTNKLEDRKTGIISVNAENAFDKVQHVFVINALETIEIHGNTPK